MILGKFCDKRESWIGSGVIHSCFQNSNISVLCFKQNLNTENTDIWLVTCFKGISEFNHMWPVEDKKSITASWVIRNWWGIKYSVMLLCGRHKMCFRWVMQLHWGCFEAQSVRREQLPETAGDHSVLETCLICRIFLHQFYNLDYLNNSKISHESIQHYIQRA